MTIFFTLFVIGIPSPYQDAEEIADELWKLLLVGKERIERASKAGEDHKVALQKANEVEAAAKLEVTALRDQVAVFEGRLASRNAELEASKLQEKNLTSSQGPLIRAAVTRVLLSGSFSTLVSDVASVFSQGVSASVVEEIAKDIPDLDIEKYGYEEPSQEELDLDYAMALAKGMDSLPVLDELASSSGSLTVEGIHACQTDHDPVLEVNLAVLAKEKHVARNQQGPEDQQTGGGNDSGSGSRQPLVS